MKIISIYPNCSLGGMATVYRNRILFEPGDKHYLLFTKDAGGLSSFESLENTTTRIIRKDRLKGYVDYLAGSFEADEVRITSNPELPALLSGRKIERVIYEFHTSTEAVIASEIELIDFDSVDEIWTPSKYLSEVVAQMLPETAKEKLTVRANLVNTNIFNDAPSEPQFSFGGLVPLLWVGRFDKGKNPKDFVRILAKLPEGYVGLFVVSLEGEADRADDFFSETCMFGVDHKIRLLMNLSPQTMGELYQAVRRCGGAYCSTSLAESFGYSVAEGLSAGVSVIAYDVGAIGEFRGRDLHLIGVGEIDVFAQTIARVCPAPSKPLARTILAGQVTAAGAVADRAATSRMPSRIMRWLGAR